MTALSELEAHFALHLGAPSFVWHELISSEVHIDVHAVLPTQERPYYTLVTSGMSDKPMSVPPDLERGDALRFAELMLMLPEDWFRDPRSSEALEDERRYWPIRLLKALARFPHECETWLGFGHTVPNGDPPAPYAVDTELCCALLVPPVRVPPAFYELQLRDGREINVYAVVPLYAEELQLKLTRGTDALLDRFDVAEVTELLDPRRENTCQHWLDQLSVN